MSKSWRRKPRPSNEDRLEADKWQYGLIESYGFTTDGVLLKADAYAIIAKLQDGSFRPDNRFKIIGPTSGQLWLLERLGVPTEKATCKRYASFLISAVKEPLRLYKKRVAEID